MHSIVSRLSAIRKLATKRTTVLVLAAAINLDERSVIAVPDDLAKFANHEGYFMPRKALSILGVPKQLVSADG